MLMFSACGKRQYPIPAKEALTTTSFENESVKIPLQYSSCQRQVMEVASFDVELFLNGELSKVASYYIEKKNVISDIFHGEESEYFLVANNYELKEIKKPRPLKLCQDDTILSRNTIESAAVSTSYFIQKTNQRFAQIRPEIRLDPIELHILPSIKRTIIERNRDGSTHRRSLFMTDNAFYVPSENIISFLPHSKTMKRSGLDVNLWEVPMVASHEYGHHIFQSIVGKTSRLTEGCFGHSSHQGLLTFTQGRTVSIEDVISAYNEGFADLVSWYTLEPQERSVLGVRCLEMTRDVGSSRFYDGKMKKFSAEALQVFFSEKSILSAASCESVNFQEIHVLGAIFAHTTDQLLRHLKIADKQKLALIADWVKYLKNEERKSSLMSPQAYLRETYSKLLRMGIHRSGIPFERRICRKIEEYFPGLNLSECDF
jgi:hypothetical protein